jgi:hypothetical protein
MTNSVRIKRIKKSIDSDLPDDFHVTEYKNGVVTSAYIFNTITEAMVHVHDYMNTD